jgi:hypothetical protein
MIYDATIAFSVTVYFDATRMLEERCWKAARNVAKELFLQALKQKEEKLLSEAEGEKKGESR